MTKKKKTSSHQPGGSLKERLKKEILAYTTAHPVSKFNYKQVAAKIGVTDKQTRALVLEALYELTHDNFLREVQTGKFMAKKMPKGIEGIVDATARGAAYIVVDGLPEDVYVPQKYMAKAMHGDKVEVVLRAKKTGKPEGIISKIIQRSVNELVGTIQINGNVAFLVPNNSKLNTDFFVPIEKLNGAKTGEKVRAKFTDWPDHAKSPYAHVIEVLGNPGESKVEMESILIDKGFPLAFKPETEAEAAKIQLEIPQSEIDQRLDLRGITTCTIDPVDAKDFDDALSVEYLNNDLYKIGVHIADVSHYVRPNTALDNEAIERATSVYLVDRVIPMLPEVLSNGVCSLRPNEDKLAFSVLFTLDNTGKVHNFEIVKTVIHSNRRFAYEEVQEILEGKSGDLEKELILLDSLAKKIRAKRMKSGAIAFNSREMRFVLNDEKQPVGVTIKVQKDAHKLIEEFMLLANRTVAEFIGKPKKGEAKPFVYRVHDLPDPEKLSTFSQFVSKFGHKFNFNNVSKIADSMNTLLNEVAGKREESVIGQLAIRAMAKAFYTTENIGHYGLAFSHYSHFTSPIRRYPDVMVHRLLHDYLQGKPSFKPDQLEDWCKHSSEMERKATEAERDSVKFYQVLYMKDHVGEKFSGTVSGLSDFGIFVELDESHCEGMIRLREINDDVYFFDADNYCVSGHNTGQTIHLGDSVTVILSSADLVNKKLDFDLIDVTPL